MSATSWADVVQVHSLLAQAGARVPRDTVASWSREARNKAASWAAERLAPRQAGDLPVPEVLRAAKVKPPRRAALREGLTPRQREVLAREPGPLTAAQLLRESPRRACVVCWRDLGRSAGEGALACARLVGSVAVCSAYLTQCRHAKERAQERAKLTLLAEAAP
jgi:hypothetical protein